MNQIYTILGVNCLINALILSILHLLGVKQGDRQLTAVGVVVALLFLLVTKGEPLEKMSPRRPPSSVLCWPSLTSITAQFTIHFVFIMVGTVLAQDYLDPYDPSLVPDGSFNPNVLNTSTFLISVIATVNTFWINYEGRPFMKDLKDQKVLLKSLQACYCLLFACALDVFPPLNDLLQLESLPTTTSTRSRLFDNPFGHLFASLGFRMQVVLIMVCDCVTVYVAQKSIKMMTS